MNLFAKILLKLAGNTFRGIGLSFYLIGAIVAWITIISVNDAAVSNDAFWGSEVTYVTAGLVAYGIMRLGHVSYLYGKRILARRQMHNAFDLLSRGGPSPVLYLRSFADDKITAETPITYDFRDGPLPRLSTEEEHLAEAIGDIGPFVAVSDANEKLPHLGATRIPANEDWRATVTELMSRSQLVIFRVGFGESLWWEIERALELVDHQRVLFLIPNKAGVFDAFRQKLQPMLSVELADLAGEMQTASTIGAILYFDSGGVPCLSPVVQPKFGANRSKPLLPMLRIALRPIYKQLGLKWVPPPIPRRTIAGIIAAGYVMGLAIYGLWDAKLWEFTPRFDFETLLTLVLSFLILIPSLAGASYWFVRGLLNIHRASKQFKGE